MKHIPVHLIVNNEEHDLLIQPQTTLLEVLRDELDLTGLKEGCSLGVCGSCTVLMNDKPVRSCLTLALEAEGSRILTVEGLAADEHLDPLQEAFIEHGAVQCGFCTSGMLMSSKALLLHNPDPDKTDIKRALSGNICRCTGYVKIIKAVSEASQKSSIPDT